MGKSSSADLRIEHPQVEAEHAYIEESQGRLYCTALAGDTAESIAQRASTALAGDEDAFQISMTDTWTWLQDRQLLRGAAQNLVHRTCFLWQKQVLVLCREGTLRSDCACAYRGSVPLPPRREACLW